MLRFSPEDPELRRIFKLRTYRYYLMSPGTRDPVRFLTFISGKLGVAGLSLDGAGDPAAWIGTADEPRAHPVYWRR